MSTATPPRPTEPAQPARRTRTRLVAAGLAALAVLTVGGLTLTDRGSGTSAPAGQPAPQGQQYLASGTGITPVAVADRQRPRDLAGTTLDGEPFRLADHRGKVVVLNTWAHWCAPCREESPDLQRAWERLQARDVQFVGVNTRDDEIPARAFVARFGLTYPTVADPDGALMLPFRDTVPPIYLPSTLILDRQGRVATRVLGPTSEITLRNLVEDVLAEGPG